LANRLFGDIHTFGTIDNDRTDRQRRKFNKMLGKNCFRKLISSFTAFAVLTVYSTVALAVPAGSTAEITVTGQVTVNGQTAVSNSTIISGSTIVTGPNSSAVVSFGKAGRVELSADSNIVLNFSPNSIVGILSAGVTRVSNAAGVAASVTTRNATVIADAGQADNFIVEVECSHTHVETLSGLVTVREGSTDRQVAAGTSVIAGNLSQTGCGPCIKPDSAPRVRTAGPWWLILLAAGVAGAAIIFGSQRNRTTIGGGTIVVSPVR
jgi:hypothetical protein